MSVASGDDAGDPGLQAERTSLAWTRTSLALLANGALLMLRDPRSVPGRLGLAAVGFAVVVALAAYVIGRRRQSLLSSRPLPHSLTPRLEVYLLGFAVLGLIVVSLLTATR
jgi:uncharacterized membrane protein YidH (DUF202 family)